MEEKEKRTSKEEEGSGYGLTADSDHCELTTDDRTPFSENAETRRLQNAFGEALGDLPLPDEVRKNGPHSCNGRHSRSANFISASVYPVVWQQPLPCYCYFGPLGTSQARTASSRTSKSSPPSMHRNKLPLSKRTAESSYLPRPPRPPASHWRTEVTSF